MNGYICFYKGKRFECRAVTSLAAQTIAAKHFKAKKSWEVSVTLVEKNGEPVEHSPAEFG